ncbi:hypothetical protein ACWGOQ_0017970 [Aquimarina sp. M1]
MNTKIFIFIVLLGILFSSCDDSDCVNIVCAPDATFRFELLNTNEENLISNGTLQLSDIEISNPAN